METCRVKDWQGKICRKKFRDKLDLETHLMEDHGFQPANQETIDAHFTELIERDGID